MKRLLLGFVERAPASDVHAAGKPNRPAKNDEPIPMSRLMAAVGNSAALTALAGLEAFGRSLLLGSLVPLVASAVVCVFLLAVTRKAIVATLPPTGLSGQVYRFAQPQWVRHLAKLGFLILVPLSWFRLTDLLPNAATGRSELIGYACDAGTGLSLPGVQVHVYDVSGTLASVTGGETDDIGFFGVALERWRLRPYEVRVVGGCGGPGLRVEGASTGDRCLKSDPYEEGFVYYFECE